MVRQVVAWSTCIFGHVRRGSKLTCPPALVWGVVLVHRKSRLFWILVLPALSVYTLIVVYPLFSGLTCSLFQWNGVVRGGFTGLGNFKRLFSLYPYSDLMWNAFANNIKVFASQLLIRTPLALVLAAVVLSKVRGGGAFRTLFFLPRILPTVVVGFLWTMILNTSFGALNSLLTRVGLASLVKPWLGRPDTAMLAVILLDTWYWVGFYMIIFIAGLQSIPAAYTEAAMMDGAGSWTTFTKITLPLLAPSITITTVLTFVQSFQIFDLVFSLTGSGGQPNHATDVLGLMFYRITFGEAGGAPADVALGSALAALMFIFIFGVSSLIASFLRKREVGY